MAGVMHACAGVMHACAGVMHACAAALRGKARPAVHPVRDARAFANLLHHTCFDVFTKHLIFRLSPSVRVFTGLFRARTTLFTRVFTIQSPVI